VSQAQRKRAYQLDLGIWPVVGTTLAVVILGIDFGLLALLVGAHRGSRGHALGVSAAVAAASYLISSLGAVSSLARAVRPASLLYWAIGDNQLESGPTVLGLALLVAVGLCSSLRHESSSNDWTSRNMGRPVRRNQTTTLPAVAQSRARAASADPRRTAPAATNRHRNPRPPHAVGVARSGGDVVRPSDQPSSSPDDGSASPGSRASVRGASSTSMSMSRASLRATPSLMRPDRDASDNARFCTAASRRADMST